MNIDQTVLDDEVMKSCPTAGIHVMDKDGRETGYVLGKYRDHFLLIRQEGRSGIGYDFSAPWESKNLLTQFLVADRWEALNIPQATAEALVSMTCKAWQLGKEWEEALICEIRNMEAILQMRAAASMPD